jgi:DNA polymerase-1
VVCFDTETALIRPANLAPPLVCVTWQSPGEEAQIVHHADPECERLIRGWLEDPDILLVGHNVAYDAAVIGERFPHLLPLIFAAYAADRVTDTMIRQQLLDIAAGRYPKGAKAKGAFTLEKTAKRCAGIELQKDEWRLSYGRFVTTPLAGWIERAREVQAEAAVRLAELEATADPDDKEQAERIRGLREMVGADPSRCTTYPLDDARATLASFLAQERHASYLADQYRQARAAFALHLSSAWGLRTDAAGVEILQKETEAELEECEAELIAAGLVKANGVRDTKVAMARMIRVCAERGIKVPRTDAHDPRKTPEDRLCTLGDACPKHVRLDSNACQESEDEILISYEELSALKKVLSNDVKALRSGVQYPIHTRYGLAETGRTTSSKPNIQNWARGRKCKVCDGKGDGCNVCLGSGTRAGAREAFIPRPGYVFAEADYPQLELYTLAQCCVSWFGRSKLADALNAGLDPHLAVAAILTGISYDEAKKALKDKSHPLHKRVKENRGASKPANFGWPGGLGEPSYIDYAKKGYGVVVTPAQARDVKDVWLAAWPEMHHHFDRVRKLCKNDLNRAFVETLWTQRFRGNATYCAACNNGFQGLGADCAKNAAWLLAEEQYVANDNASPLFNTRAVAFIHDEFILEVPDDDRAHDAAVRLAEVMVAGANVYLPDVPIPMSKMEPLLMRRWSKNAVSTFDDRKRLVPWSSAAEAA